MNLAIPHDWTLHSIRFQVGACFVSIVLAQAGEWYWRIDYDERRDGGTVASYEEAVAAVKATLERWCR